jgi:hypothetical protein
MSNTVTIELTSEEARAIIEAVTKLPMRMVDAGFRPALSVVEKIRKAYAPEPKSQDAVSPAPSK